MLFDIKIISNKISNGTRKPIIKLTQDIMYGISRSKSCLLSDIARDLKEKAIVYMEMMVSDIKEILRYARTRIREWKHIETREIYKPIRIKNLNKTIIYKA